MFLYAETVCAFSTSYNIFLFLFLVYLGMLLINNYLYRAIKKMKSNSDSSLLSALRSSRGERILEVDGTVTTQPVLEHVGLSAWPGELLLQICSDTICPMNMLSQTLLVLDSIHAIVKVLVFFWFLCECRPVDPYRPFTLF